MCTTCIYCHSKKVENSAVYFQTQILSKRDLNSKNEPFGTGEKQIDQEVLLIISWKATVECQMISKFINGRPKLAILQIFF